MRFLVAVSELMGYCKVLYFHFLLLVIVKERDHEVLCIGEIVIKSA